MTRYLSATIAACLLSACHFHSRAWVAQRANDKAPVKVVSDTQPVVKQQGDTTPAPAPKLHMWSRATATTPMSRSTFFTSDGRTIGRFLMANDVDVSFARVAAMTSTNEDVKAFARRMLTDHAQVISAMRELASAEEITPADDDAGRDLRDLSTLQRDSLRALSGRAFDNAYVGMELDRHREILSMIDDVLLPRARNSELREALTSARPIIAAHIAHAEQLLATLAKQR
jgi:putative membrane protein